MAKENHWSVNVSSNFLKFLSCQDFINVSFLEAGSNTKTLGVRPNTTAQDLCNQCADKFEVLDPESYCLSVLVEGHFKHLAPEEFPLMIKSTLHHSEPRMDYYFVYRHGRWPEQESVDQMPTTPAPEESLIWTNAFVCMCAHDVSVKGEPLAEGLSCLNGQL